MTAVTGQALKALCKKMMQKTGENMNCMYAQDKYLDKKTINLYTNYSFGLKAFQGFPRLPVQT